MQAVQFALSLWGVLLEVVASELKSPADVLRAEWPERVRRVLPALRLLSLWHSVPAMHELYAQLSSLDGLETPM